jgi:hypothetical protein
MNRLVLITFLMNALPVVSTVYADDAKDDEVALMCRCRSYLKLRLRGPAAEAAVGIDPRQYCVPAMPQMPQTYSPPPQLYAPEPRTYVPPERPYVAPEPMPRYVAPEPRAVVCPESDGCDILTKLAVLHFLANNDARRDSRRDADRGDSELNKDSLAALQLFQNRGRDDVNKEALAILKILENQQTQIGLSQAQTVLLQEIVAGMRQVQVPPVPSQLPAYPPPASDRGPAPAPPPAPSYNRSSLPSSMGAQGRVFYRDTVFRK